MSFLDRCPVRCGLTAGCAVCRAPDMLDAAPRLPPVFRPAHPGPRRVRQDIDQMSMDELRAEVRRLRAQLLERR